MIKYFRKIRQNLLLEGKTGKYFKYALGEIILVVIGILIALSINNWNEQIKNSKKEILILNDIKTELISNLRELKSDYKNQMIFFESTLRVYDYIQKKPKEVDSMYVDFYRCVGFDYFFPKTSIYETLKSGNLEIIKSDEIKNLITDVYEYNYNRLINKVDTRRNSAQLLFPYYQKHFRTEKKPIQISITKFPYTESRTIMNL